MKYFITAIAIFVAADYVLCEYTDGVSFGLSLVALLIPFSLELIRYLTIWAYERTVQKKVSIGLLLFTELVRFLLVLILFFACVRTIQPGNKVYPIIYCVSFFAFQGITIYALKKRYKM
ncbi:MAG: hypothetical protein J6Y82_09560 [Bacteroidales bacterium]|nr:hypothetical protein [Bacteroidales bacterium]